MTTAAGSSPDTFPPTPSSHTLSLAQAIGILDSHGQLREIIADGQWARSADALGTKYRDMVFTDISYDSRDVGSQTLLFCKGRFEASYFTDANSSGLPCYVAQEDFSGSTGAAGIIVNDIKKSMALLSAAFFGYPSRRLTVIGITGTKGKTTTAYFTHSILNAYSRGKAALLSSVDNCTDGHTFVESDLTTPESLDLFRLMCEAADNGMKYLVMEVSSQAYKVNRVYGLHFDAGAFLNISPDHISPIEHPTFEDYFYCKRQITANSSHIVINADLDHAELVEEDALRSNAQLSRFRLSRPPVSANSKDVYAYPSSDGQSFLINAGTTPLGAFTLSIAGDFNYANAAAAAAIVQAAGMDLSSPSVQNALHAMEKVTIAGRMEIFTSSDGTVGIVDYAHNGVSTAALLDYVDKTYGLLSPRIILITGSAGNKAYDRRREIVEAAQDRISRFIFTTEDTDTEKVQDICEEMEHYITNTDVEHSIIIDRTEALREAVSDAHKASGQPTVILAIGKGNERWIKQFNKHVPYEGDDAVMKGLLHG